MVTHSCDFTGEATDKNDEYHRDGEKYREYQKGKHVKSIERYSGK
jgi:hypothetical protein